MSEYIPPGMYKPPATAPAYRLVLLRVYGDAIDPAVYDTLARASVPDVWQDTGIGRLLAAAYAAESLLEYNMVGTILPGAWAAGSVPGYALPCDGSMYNRVDYPQLYAILDPAYKDTADTFHTPNLSGRVPVGESASFAIGTSGGASTHTLTKAEIPRHTHGYLQGQYALFGEGLEVPASVDTAPVVAQTGDGFDGGLRGNAHNNMQPYHTVRYYIIAR